jgi:hypothetical protein
MDRLNKLGKARPIPQHVAQLPNGHRDHVLADKGLGPDGREQRVFGNELTRLGH